MRKNSGIPLGKTVYQGVLMEIDDALARIHRLPDGATLTSSEAALFLRLSMTQLDRLRSSGAGPAYMQGGSYGAKGTNQACTYHKADLAAWQSGNKVHSPMAAAVRRGQAFSTLADLAQVEAFYVDELGRVDAIVERTSVQTVVQRLGVWEIAWMTPVEAASREWADLATHRALATELTETLASSKRALEAGVNSTELGEGVASSPDAGRSSARGNGAL